jgi:hypothetical protein
MNWESYFDYGSKEFVSITVTICMWWISMLLSSFQLHQSLLHGKFLSSKIELHKFCSFYQCCYMIMSRLNCVHHSKPHFILSLLAL